MVASMDCYPLIFSFVMTAPELSGAVVLFPHHVGTQRPRGGIFIFYRSRSDFGGAVRSGAPSTPSRTSERSPFPSSSLGR